MPTRRELANAIRALSMDAVQKANSGHPGAPMGMADIAEVLWRDVLKFNPGNPTWIDRDRFVLSNGHASMLLYAMLHLSGVKPTDAKDDRELAVTLDDIKKFRQLDSKCAGHPEYRWTSGVECTTGPLGQGVGGLGHLAVQYARLFGASVIAIDVEESKLRLAGSLGAERVIDYTKGDFTRGGEKFDGLLDAVGKTTYLRCRRLLKPQAMFVGTDMGPWGQTLLLTIWSAITRRGRVTVPFPRPMPGFADLLKARMEAGEFRAVIDRRYPLEAIADAYRYVETGQKTGIVVINVI